MWTTEVRSRTVPIVPETVRIDLTTVRIDLTNENLARLVKAFRIAHGYTQAQLGRRLGISKNAVCNVERGRDYVLAPTLIRLMKLGIVRYGDL